jgi:hypothetical protein
MDEIQKCSRLRRARGSRSGKQAGILRRDSNITIHGHIIHGHIIHGPIIHGPIIHDSRIIDDSRIDDSRIYDSRIDDSRIIHDSHIVKERDGDACIHASGNAGEWPVLVRRKSVS